ncbi:LuxR C-terminal-related transcriptional regulator [Adonisia turfae]|uniref:LuxR family transcriptional regulator n=1 Tax=Adonisia turfae CCMR0081 TaxID=2292702 RepID=A0A6M0RSF1_9CYAN|nr:LuxR C-terminal-related transcriptional regulator [Adonisia turfae]NEZ59039.1 LuxR family transcriptional regulator [Adonisia turfae CCMR0081]
MEPLIKAPLQSLFQTIVQAQTEAELSQVFMAEVGQYFAAKRWNLYFLDQLPTLDDRTPPLLKKALSLDHNPVLRYLMQNHAAVHDEVILPPGVWQTICPRADHGHVMVGPIVSQGQLVGGIAVTRHRQDPKFTTENLADLSALCLHVSTRLAVLQAKPAPIVFHNNCLTPREAQIAELVARGMTNKEIGTELWITENSVKQALKRMFRKLKVSSRAEMVAQLAS